MRKEKAGGEVQIKAREQYKGNNRAMQACVQPRDEIGRCPMCICVCVCVCVLGCVGVYVCVLI